MLFIFSFFSIILCFVCLRYVSCVTNVASVDGLFISDCLSRTPHPLPTDIFDKRKKQQQKNTKNTTSEQYQNIIKGGKIDTLNTHINSELQKIHMTEYGVTPTPLKIGDKFRCSGRESSSCSTSGTRRVNLVINSVISQD
jgi:hypothetical protein